MNYNPFTLIGKTILVTGASSGIGKATAIECSKMGARLIITGRSESKLINTMSLLENGPSHKLIVADFEKNEDIEKLKSKIDCKLDGIVHSAGILESIPFAFTNEVKLSKTMRVNFEIPFILSQHLIRSKLIERGSSIVFVSSLSGISTIATGISAYAASKGAVCASIKVMALELASKNIRVNSICPGMVKTEMNMNNANLTEEQLAADEKRNYPLGYGSPIQVAHTILFLLSNASSWITGSNLIIDGGSSIQ
jgi:NAD(P)-dependent dehydrogenase (short-subunit alcohol dehydrogenase family)